MKLSLQAFGHYAVLKVTESVNPDQFPALKAGILKVSQHDKIVGKLAVVLDVSELDGVIGEKKEISAALGALATWATETGVMLQVVSGLPGLGQAPTQAEAKAKLDSPTGKQLLAAYISERETAGMAKQIEQAGQRIEEHQALRRKAAVSRAQSHQLAHAVADVWKDRRAPFELASHAKRVALVAELINKVPSK